MPSITLNIRLVLLTFILLCATALLGIAQQFIANAAELSPSSALFDPTAQDAFDPAAALMTGELFSADGVDIANLDTMNVDPNSPAGTTVPSGGPIDSMSIAAAAALTETLVQDASAAPAGHAILNLIRLVPYKQAKAWFPPEGGANEWKAWRREQLPMLPGPFWTATWCSRAPWLNRAITPRLTSKPPSAAR